MAQAVSVLLPTESQASLATVSQEGQNQTSQIVCSEILMREYGDFRVLPPYYPLNIEASFSHLQRDDKWQGKYNSNKLPFIP